MFSCVRARLGVTMEVHRGAPSEVWSFDNPFVSEEPLMNNLLEKHN